MTKVDYLDEYCRRGWKLVRLRPRSKKPYKKKWQVEDSDPREFSEGDNVGIVLGEASGGLVDIDLDQPEAVLVGSDLLPPTEVVFSRPSCLGAHRLYRVSAPGKTIRLKDSDRNTIVEYRANDSLTMVPPSVHPDGEQVSFEQFGERGGTTPDYLLDRCRLLAVVVEVSRQYRNRNRHDIALALSGVLVRQGHDRAAVRACIEALCAIAGDEEPEDRLRAADDTLSRHALGESISAWEALREAIGERRAGHVAKLLGVRINEDKGPRLRAGDRHVPALRGPPLAPGRAQPSGARLGRAGHPRRVAPIERLPGGSSRISVA